MHPNLIDTIPLSPAATKMRDMILGIPRTREPFLDDLPDGLSADEINDLYDVALSGRREAIPELRRAIMRFPDYPVLKNYMRSTHIVRGEMRQAKQVLRDMEKLHPDYLFTRMGLADEALDRDKPDRALEKLGGSLDIREVFPERDVFHVAELRHFYLVIAKILARTERQDQAVGVMRALKVVDHDPKVDEIITREVMLANMNRMRERLKADEKRLVSVKTGTVSKTIAITERRAFRNEAVGNLLYHGHMLDEADVKQLLALPRESLLADLRDVLADCIDRTPYFMHGRMVDEDDFAAYHALHLLAEIRGVEACPELLAFLSMPPEAVDFWLGDYRSYLRQIARIVAGNVGMCLEWLKSPGINARAKGMVAEALEDVAKGDAACLEEIRNGLSGVLEFVIESPKHDNVLDTGLIFMLISVLAELRAKDSLRVIRRAYEKDLVEIFKCGDLHEIETDMDEPMAPSKTYLPILEQYAAYASEGQDEPEEDPMGGFDPSFMPTAPGFPAMGNLPSLSVERKTALINRNDPCPCGSGKKYKKCCMS